MKNIIALTIFLVSLSSYAQGLVGMRDSEKIKFLESHHSVSQIVLEKEEIPEEISNFAKTQAEIWPDTVLEGDVVQTAEAKIEKVTLFVRGNEILAYQVVITADAIDTSSESCVQSEDGQSWSGAGCVAGQVVERAFADAQFNPIFSRYFPEFVAHQ